jgi:hypothetical protein
MRSSVDVERRAAVHAALGDPVRLVLVDELVLSDRSPVELRRLLTSSRTCWHTTSTCSMTSG